MCGSWDGNPNNDLQQSDGQMTGSPNAFAESWRVTGQDGCPAAPPPTDPCDLASRDTRHLAEQMCAKYKSNPFKQCPVDVTQFYEVRLRIAKLKDEIDES